MDVTAAAVTTGAMYASAAGVREPHDGKTCKGATAVQSVGFPASVDGPAAVSGRQLLLGGRELRSRVPGEIATTPAVGTAAATAAAAPAATAAATGL